MKGHKCPKCEKAWRCAIRECKADDHVECGDCYAHLQQQPKVHVRSPKIST